MKCVEFQETGVPAAVLKCVDREKPVPRHGEVLVRMLASPINPSDMMFIQGNYGIPPTLPQVPGFEGVGIVESSGGGLRGKLFRGRRVAVLNGEGGNWAQYVVVPSDRVVPLSSSLTVEQAATFFVNPATAWIMTQEVLQVRNGAWLLQTAAGSSLGRMIIRLGKVAGFRTLNVVRRQQTADELLKLGADEVVVFDPENGSQENQFRDQVHSIVGKQELKAAIDPVGGATGSAVLSVLSTGGRFLAYGTLSDEPLQFSGRTLMTHQLALEGFWLGRFMAAKSLVFKLRLVRRITRLIRAGVLDSRISRRCSLSDIQQAVTAGHDGKTLLQMED